MHHHHHTTILQLPNRATGQTHTTGAGPDGAVGWATNPTAWGGRVGYRRVARQLGATAVHPHSWPTRPGPATGWGHHRPTL